MRGGPPKERPASRVPSPRGLDPVCSSCYLMILRATRPPATNRAPAPSANSDAAPLPPVFGSSFGGGGGAGAGALGGGGGGAFGGSGSHGAFATTPPALETM